MFPNNETTPCCGPGGGAAFISKLLVRKKLTTETNYSLGFVGLFRVKNLEFVNLSLGAVIRTERQTWGRSGLMEANCNYRVGIRISHFCIERKLYLWWNLIYTYLFFIHLLHKFVFYKLKIVQNSCLLIELYFAHYFAHSE